MQKQKICIIGGSLTGLTTAISLSKLNCQIDLITSNIKKNKDSNRTIAISETNLSFLKKLKVFKAKKQQAWPCSVMELYTGGNKGFFSKIFEFKKKQKNILYMIKNSVLEKLIIKKIKKTKSISIKRCSNISEIGTSGLMKSIKVNKKNYKYNLIIICTGSNSNLVKKNFSNHHISNSYKEMSITTILNHKYFKNNVVRQFFFKNEILALLPISNNKTSIVWSVKKDIYKINNTLVKNKIKNYLKNYLKKINFTKKIEYKDLNFLIRNKYFKDRILLFGDSLHTIHPFVGQGFNMTLRDLLSLEKILFNKTRLGLDIGSSDILSEFSNETKPRNFVQLIGINLIKNSFALKKEPVVKVRNSILKTLNKSNLAKNLFYNIADQGVKF